MKRPVPLSILALGVLAFGVALVVALGPMQGVPHVNDEIVYTLQARLFAAGMRTGPPAFAPELLDFPMWVAAPRSHGVFPPGWPALLAVGEALGAPWLVNPALAALLPLLTWALLREDFEHGVALTAAAIMAVSPAVWLLSASRMSQTSVLVALLLAAVVVRRGRDGPLAWLGAGAAVAYVVLARPFDAAVLGGPLLLLGLWRAPAHPARLLLLLAPTAAAGLLLLDNHALTGDALTFPVSAWFDATAAGRPGCNALGFGAQIGCQPTLGDFGHTPAKALSLAALSAERTDRLLLGFPGVSLLCLAGLWLGRRRVLPLLAFGLLPVFAYALYWSPGAAYGARFWHPTLVLLALLLALPLHRLAGRWAPLLLLAPLLLRGPVVAADAGDHYWCVDDSVARLLAEQGVDDGLVLVQARGERPMWWPQLRVAMTCDATMELGDALVVMDPTGRAPGLQPRRAPSSREELDALAAAWPADRPVWLLQHDIAADRLQLVQVRAGAP